MKLHTKILIFTLPTLFFITSCKDCKVENIKKPDTVETDSILMKCYQDLNFICKNEDAQTNFFSFDIGSDRICYTEDIDLYTFEYSRGQKSIVTGSENGGRFIFRVKMEPETIWLNSVQGYYPNAKPIVGLTLDTKDFFSDKEYIEKYFKVGDMALRKKSYIQPDATEEQPEGTFVLDYECTCGEYPDNNQGLLYVSYPDTHIDDYLKCTENIKEETNTDIIYHIKLAFKIKMYRWQGEYWTTFENGSFVFDVKIPK
jgi:hypothetical protein